MNMIYVCYFAHTPEQLRVQPYTRRQTILKLFEEMIQWRRRREKVREEDPFRFNWTHFHLSILHTYVFRLGLDSNFRVLRFANFFEDKFWYGTSGSSVRDAVVKSFARDLQEFFVLPKRHHLFQRDDNLKRDELVAAFINLLLRLLQYHGEVSINSLEDIIKRLNKVVGFLLTIVGDISLICYEHEQAQNLLAEIEVVANEAGSLLHSFVFSTSDDRIFETMYERLDLLLKHVDLLGANVIKFSELQQQPVITETNITPKTDAVSFLFIVDSLLYDLENLLNQEDAMISNVKDKIKELQQELKLSKSFMKVSQYSEMEELKEHYGMRIRDMAYAAEYLINSFLVGDAPSRYFYIRLSLLIQKIKLVETEIQETNKKYDIVASEVAKNLSVLSVKNDRSSEVDDIIVGFEDKVEYILDYLLGEEKHLQIIFIFGMPVFNFGREIEYKCGGGGSCA